MELNLMMPALMMPGFAAAMAPHLKLAMAMVITISFTASLMGATSIEDQLEDSLDLYSSGYFSSTLGEQKDGVPRTIQANASFIQDSINKLAGFSDTPAPSVTRILYSDEDMAARCFIRSLMLSAGLSVREDAIGNIYGRWEGNEPLEPAVASGSHIDAIPYAGKYDGVLGVVGAIEAVNALRRAGFKPRKAVEVIMFTSEEPTRFALSCIGSRMMAADSASIEFLRVAVDKGNTSFFEAAKRAGYEEAHRLDTVAVRKGTYAAFVELHIEQGPVLEEQGIPIGIVTAIAGPASLSVDLEGDGGHAGAVLMHARNDAGLAAAELALAVEQHVLATGSADTVGTTGVFQVFPGAVNSIPRRAHVEIDIRDIDGRRRDAVIEKIRHSAEAIAYRRRASLISFDLVNQDAPAQSAPFIIQAAKQAAEQLGLQHKMMVSRAYHDSLFMSRIAPMSMIFIPCHKGYSHRPDEYASTEDMKNGVEVLALTLAKLSLGNEPVVLPSTKV